MPNPKFKLLDRVRIGRKSVGTIVQVLSFGRPSYDVKFDDYLSARIPPQTAVSVQEDMLERVDGGFLMFHYRRGKREFYVGVEDRNAAIILAKEATIRRNEFFEVENRNGGIIWPESRRTKKGVAT